VIYFFPVDSVGSLPRRSLLTAAAEAVAVGEGGCVRNLFFVFS